MMPRWRRKMYHEVKHGLRKILASILWPLQLQMQRSVSPATTLHARPSHSCFTKLSSNILRSGRLGYFVARSIFPGTMLIGLNFPNLRYYTVSAEAMRWKQSTHDSWGMVHDNERWKMALELRDPFPKYFLIIIANPFSSFQSTWQHTISNPISLKSTA